MIDKQYSECLWERKKIFENTKVFVNKKTRKKGKKIAIFHKNHLWQDQIFRLDKTEQSTNVIVFWVLLHNCVYIWILFATKEMIKCSQIVWIRTRDQTHRSVDNDFWFKFKQHTRKTVGNFRMHNNNFFDMIYKDEIHPLKE